MITFALWIHDTELCHDLVCVVLIPSTLLLRVLQICCWASVGICIQKLSAVDAQLAWLDICVCPPYALQQDPV